MKKTQLISIIICCTVFQYGCFRYYVQEKDTSKLHILGNTKDIFVLTTDKVLYEFKSDMYQFSSDTLKGKVYKDDKYELIKLGYSEIANVGTKESKITKFGIITFTVIGLYVAFFVIIALNAN